MVLIAHLLVQSTPAWWPWPERHRDVVHHWTDAYNLLDLIPGPPFLLIFIIYAALAILFCILLRKALLAVGEPAGLLDSNGRLPFSVKPTFLEVAYLRGGRRSMLTAAVGNLYRLGIITRGLSHVPAVFQVPAVPERASLTALESAIAMALYDAESQDAEQLRSDARVQAELEKSARTAKQKLAALGLTPTLLTWIYVVIAFLVCMAMVPGIAIIRLIRSDLRGYHNVGLLWFLLIASLVVVPWATLRNVRASGAGRRYLRKLRADAKPVIRKLQTHVEKALNAAGGIDTSVRHGADVIYALAACGGAALAGTAYADIHALLYPKREIDWSSSCSGCSGGSCGGGSCGGGGCGGGGCGGGGCGGG